MKSSGMGLRFWPAGQASSAAVLVAIILAVGATAEVEPARTPAEVLQSSLGKLPAVPFSGTKVMWSLDGEGTRREFVCNVWYSADGRERAVYEGQDKQAVKIVIYRDGKCYVWNEGADVWREDSGDCDGRYRWDNVGLIEKNYTLTRDDTYYLERRCIAVRAESTLPGRPLLKAVVDAATNVPLLVEVTMPGGRMGYGYRFEKVSFEPFDEKLFDLPEGSRVEKAEGRTEGARSFGTVEEAKGKVGFEVLSAARVPADFSVTGCNAGEGHWKKAGGEGLVIRLSDGLSTISIYQWAADGRESGGGHGFTEVKREGRSVMWAQHYRNFVLTATVGGTKAAILGEIPLEELLDLAFSLAPVK